MVMMKRQKRLPYYCPICKTEASEKFYNEELKECGEVICSVCKQGPMIRREDNDNRTKQKRP